MSRNENFSKLKLLATIALMVWASAQALAVEVPFEAEWASSGHADATSEAFVHWDADEPPEVAAGCAKCHSTPGYRDFLGADGTDAGVVDNPAPIGTTVECIACHNKATETLDSVTFPSGVEVTGLSDEARCMQCHQGRASGDSVDAKIADANVPNDDTPSGALGFINIHYYAAAATRFGGVVKGGYQYAGKSYDVKFAHVEGIDTCDSCHDPHSLEVKVDACGVCHPGVVGQEDLKDIRLVGSTSDYDGDGNTAEGIKDEIEGLQEILYGAIQAYGAAAGTPIIYDSHAYPYFFIDTDGNGQVDEGEGSYGNQYNVFTARLLKAAYNFQVSMKDPGAFAHGGKYIIQLLHDSIEDLDSDLIEDLARNDSGHFAGSTEAWRHWDDDGEVSGSCAKCHSATGLPFLMKEGISIPEPVSNGMLCTTCHDSLPEFTRYAVSNVEFPSGAKLSFGEGDEDSNLCISCHQGRSSGASVEAAVAGLDADEVSTSLRFMNIHYLPAGVTVFGTEAGGAYEYPGRDYDGRLVHTEAFDACTECHDSHSGKVNGKACVECHNSDVPRDIRRNPQPDYDDDGNVFESIADEIDGLAATLYYYIQNYAMNQAGTPIIYDSHSYPYFFVDTNGNGKVDSGESSYGNSYNAFTPRLLKAVYNYQYVMKDPGAYAHNGTYVVQVLQNTLRDLPGGD